MSVLREPVPCCIFRKCLFAVSDNHYHATLSNSMDPVKAITAINLTAHLSVRGSAEEEQLNRIRNEKDSPAGLQPSRPDVLDQFQVWIVGYAWSTYQFTCAGYQ